MVVGDSGTECHSKSSPGRAAAQLWIGSKSSRKRSNVRIVEGGDDSWWISTHRGPLSKWDVRLCSAPRSRYWRWSVVIDAVRLVHAVVIEVSGLWLGEAWWWQFTCLVTVIPGTINPYTDTVWTTLSNCLVQPP